MISKKVVLIGDFSTGKTSLIRRFVDNQFSDEYLSTLGVKISRKNIAIGESEIQNIIWDVEGGTENKPLNTTYLLGAHGVIIVADISRKSTIENLQMYIDIMQKVSLSIPIVIALNKSDLVEACEAQEQIKALRAQYHTIGAINLSSAKSAEGVSTLFDSLSNFMLEQN